MNLLLPSSTLVPPQEIAASRRPTESQFQFQLFVLAVRNLNADAISITPHIKLYHALLPNDILPIYTRPSAPLSVTNPTLAKAEKLNGSRAENTNKK